MTGPGSLRLVRLDLDRLPGITDAFSVTAEPGINLVQGPNESGKSSLVRAVFHLLWPGDPVARPFSVRAAFATSHGALQAGRDDAGPVVWSRDGTPVAAPAVPAAHLARCYRLGLLDLNRRDGTTLDRDLAREIRRQMSGGYDLENLRGLFPDLGRRLGQRQRAWQEARAALESFRGRQIRLAADERSLADLAAELETARRAERRRLRLVAAREHRVLQARAAAAQARLDQLPAGMAQVREDDDVVLAELDRRCRDKTRQVAEHEARIIDLRRQQQELAVTGDLVELDGIVQAATAADARAWETAQRLAAATSAAAAARAGLAPELLAAEVPANAAAAYASLLTLHRQRVARQARVDHLERLLEQDLLRDVAAEGAAPGTELAAQLTSDRLQPPSRARFGGGLAAVTVAVVALGAALLRPDPAGADRLLTLAVAFGFFGVALLATAWRRRRACGAARRDLETAMAAAGTPLPSGWTTGTAAEQLLAQARQTGLAEGASRSRAELRTGLSHSLAEALAAAERAAADHRDLLHSLGRDEGLDDAGLLHELDRLARSRAADGEQAAARGAHERQAAERDRFVASAQQRMVALGEAVDDSLPALEAGLRRLQARQAEAAALDKNLADAADNLRTARVDLAEAESSRAALLERLALPTLAAASGRAEADDSLHGQVRARVAARPAFLETAQELSTLRHDLSRLRAELDASGEADETTALLELEPEELAARLAEEESAAARIAELNEKVGGIRGQVAAARAGDEWERALARLDEAAADLADGLTEQRDNALGRLLLETIDRQHEDDSQPPLLAAVDRHLGLFTGGRYRLRVVGQGAEQRFVALDNADRRRELSALSDGTRAQLLLAARLAFLTDAEAGPPMPLFLDEALTASDPERFDAIAGALGALAADTGRQIFYLTSDPADLAAWERALARRDLPPAHVVDLAARRRLAAAASAAVLELPELPVVPAPGTMSAAAYGARLGVPALRPWAPEGEIHLFHLWQDDLNVVHELVRGGVATLGQWRRLGRQLVRAGRLTEAQARHIDARAAVWGAFLDAWRIGRGRPVTGADLAAADILGPTMLEPAREVLDRAGGDAAAFMALVEEGGIKRLARKKKEALQEFLEREGHLDGRGVWPPEAIVTHVLGTTAAALQARELQPDEVRRLVLELWASCRSAESGPTG